MTQTQHTTRSCSSSNSSNSNNSNNNLQRRHHLCRLQFATLSLLLLCLISCLATADAATAQSRFYYTEAAAAVGGSETQGKVRVQRETNDAAAAVDERAEVTSCCQGAAAVSVEPVTVSCSSIYPSPLPPTPPTRLT